MNRIQEMIQTHPRGQQTNLDRFVDCIHACYECVQVCGMCADACLGEEMVKELTRCIRLNLDCADVCLATGQILSRQTEPEWLMSRLQVEACARACDLCAVECEQHARMHEHCRVCAEACRRCQQACEQLLQTLAANEI